VADQPPKDMIGFLDYYFVKKAPFQLPMNVKEGIAKYGPWISIVLLVLLLPPILIVFGIGTLLIPFAGPTYGTSFTWLTLLTIVQVGMLIAALPGLFARKMQGWRLIFYSRILSILSLLLSGSIVNAIVGALVSFYILFQVRALYEEKAGVAPQDQIRTT
jgi:hypothetical protein